jgi:hypothetical protein
MKKQLLVTAAFLGIACATSSAYAAGLYFCTPNPGTQTYYVAPDNAAGIAQCHTHVANTAASLCASWGNTGPFSINYSVDVLAWPPGTVNLTSGSLAYQCVNGVAQPL